MYARAAVQAGKLTRAAERKTTLRTFVSLVLVKGIFEQPKYNLQKLLVSNIDLIATDTTEP